MNNHISSSPDSALVVKKPRTSRNLYTAFSLIFLLGLELEQFTKMMKFSALIASLLLVPADALDIVVAGVTCDKTLPIYADTFTMTCNGASRCTLGNTATFAGTRE